MWFILLNLLCHSIKSAAISFIITAPRLPPKERMQKLSSIFKISLACSLVFVKTFFLRGFPTTIALHGGSFFFAASTAKKTISAFLARNLFVIPGYAFCSCIAVLMFILLACNKTEAHVYPPVPMTMSGLNLFKISRDLKFDRKKR